jgi:uncharacterized protein YecE (DUF72 family)
VTAEIRTGGSSWTSESWWGRVYPRSVPPAGRLGVYAQLYDCVEVDSTYYALPNRRMVESWRLRTPDRFLFTLKLPRELMEPKTPVQREKIATFISTAQCLQEKLAGVLAQFPPWFRPSRAEHFLWDLLEALPSDVPRSVELRDSGWFRGEMADRLLARLRDREICLAWSCLTYVDVPPELTTDWVYLRFIGDHETVPAERHGELRVDRTRETRLWAERVLSVSSAARRILAFFNNHFAGFAPGSINMFRELVGLPAVDYARLTTPQAPPPNPSPPRTLEQFADPERRAAPSSPDSEIPIGRQMAPFAPPGPSEASARNAVERAQS